MITVPNRYGQTDRQTDRRTTYDGNTALCTKVHRAVKMGEQDVLFALPIILLGSPASTVPAPMIDPNDHYVADVCTACMGLRHEIVTAGCRCGG